MVDNIDVIKTKESPYILYVEGEDDERILRRWANALGKTDVFEKFHIYKMRGTSKNEMRKRQDEHFKALKQINSDVERVVLFDFDSEDSFHPEKDNRVIKEWKRKNIENYLLVPQAWKNAVLDVSNQTEFNLFNNRYETLIDNFFEEQNLTLPKNATWKTVNANIFEVVDGKKILFENNDSLFHRIKKIDSLIVNRESVANNMTNDMIHDEIVQFFDFLTNIVTAS